MRLLTRRTVSLMLIAVFALSFAVPFTHAQDEMTHVCDSTTIMLLFVAEYEGYEPMMDVSTFDKGQYAPLFDSMMEMMMDDEMMEEDMSEDDEMMDEDMEEDDMMEEDMSEDEMMDDMMLAPAVIADEDPACTELRTSVEEWLYAHFSMGMMMMDDEG